MLYEIELDAALQEIMTRWDVVLCNSEISARTRIVHALADALLDQKPQADTVSWMVPICRALAEGGIGAAYSCYNEIRRKGDNQFYFDDADLINFSFQLRSVNKIDLVIDVLGLNIQGFPEYLGSYFEQARLYLQKGDRAHAEICLLKAQSIQPDNSAIDMMLEKVRS
jgi:tetratricopeptide (TPR) repeat protein